MRQRADERKGGSSLVNPPGLSSCVRRRSTTFRTVNQTPRPPYHRGTARGKFGTLMSHSKADRSGAPLGQVHDEPKYHPAFGQAKLTLGKLVLVMRDDEAPAAVARTESRYTYLLRKS